MKTMLKTYSISTLLNKHERTKNLRDVGATFLCSAKLGVWPGVERVVRHHSDFLRLGFLQSISG